LGVVVFFRWHLALLQLSVYRRFGMKLIPILRAPINSGPFICVLAFYVAGTLMCAYSLGLQGFEKTFEAMYAMVFFGEVDFDDLEGVESETTITIVNGTGTLNQADAQPTDYMYITRLLYVFVTFSMSITLLNIFIAVLSEHFQRATKGSFINFMRLRAQTAVDLFLLREGWEYVVRQRRRKQGQNDLEFEDRDSTNGYDDPMNDYLWYCKIRADGPNDELSLDRDDAY
jgi:hypothetical protein